MVKNTPAEGCVNPFQTHGEHHGSQYPWINGNGSIYYHSNRLPVDFICQDGESRGLNQRKEGANKEGGWKGSFLFHRYDGGVAPFPIRC